MRSAISCGTIRILLLRFESCVRAWRILIGKGLTSMLAWKRFKRPVGQSSTFDRSRAAAPARRNTLHRSGERSAGRSAPLNVPRPTTLRLGCRESFTPCIPGLAESPRRAAGGAFDLAVWAPRIGTRQGGGAVTPPLWYETSYFLGAFFDGDAVRCHGLILSSDCQPVPFRNYAP